MQINVADYQENGASAEADAAVEVGADPARFEVPSDWRPCYSEQERADVGLVVEWLNRTGKPQSWLARVSRVNAGTLNQVLKGSYNAAPSKFLSAMLDAIADAIIALH